MSSSILCPQCNKNEANSSREYGILYCDDCQLENALTEKPSQSHTYDFASPKTKEERKSYGDAMFQPYVNGVLSKEFVDVYGTDKLAGVTKKDVKKAKYVYGSHTRHHKMIENGIARERARFKNPDKYEVIEGKDNGTR